MKQWQSISLARYESLDFPFYVVHSVTGQLSHWGWVVHICVGNLTIIGSDSGLALTRRRYLNKCWNIVNVTLRNKLQGNFNRNSNSFIQENVVERIVCEMAAILSRPQCANYGVNMVVVVVVYIAWKICIHLQNEIIKTFQNSGIHILRNHIKKFIRNMEFFNYFNHTTSSFS